MWDNLKELTNERGPYRDWKKMFMGIFKQCTKIMGWRAVLDTIESPLNMNRDTLGTNDLIQFLNTPAGSHAVNSGLTEQGIRDLA